MSQTTPEPYSLRAADIVKAVRGRRESFAPEWRPSRKEDAGNVFTAVFGDMANTVAECVRGLPRKAQVESLRVAGIAPLSATPAEAMVVFTVADAAPEPVVIGSRFPLGAAPRAGGDMVVFETERSLVALPGKIQRVASIEGSAVRDLTALNDDPVLSYFPFGTTPRVGWALLLGLSTEAEPGPSLTLGIGLTAPSTGPTPASSGALYPAPTGPSVELVWEALDGGQWLTAVPVRDETNRLAHSGVVELALPNRFRKGTPGEAPAAPLLRWLRVRIASGSFSRPPAFDFVRMNAVRATAGRTVRDEVLAQIADPLGNRFKLAKTPVLPGSLTLEVDEGAGFMEWTAVADLSKAGPNDTVYAFDPQRGEVTFGDDVHGRRLPTGSRNVRAAVYRWGGGAAGSVKAHAVKVLLGTAGFLAGVDNPRASSGGDDQESLDDSTLHGPQAIRAHGRAVLPSDYELLALRAPGARVRRVHAMPHLHPSLPSAVTPGVVGLVVVPPEDPDAPYVAPLPDEQTLLNVARSVAESLSLAGVEVVAAPPTYHFVRVEAELRLSRDADQGAVLSGALADLRRYLHPLTGGDEGTGWPFGAPLRYHDLLRRLLQSSGIFAVPSLTIIADGRRLAACDDFAIGAHELLWPQDSLLIPLEDA